MNRPTTLAMLFALATWLMPNVDQAKLSESTGTGLDDLHDTVALHGIEREGDIPLP